MNNIDLPELELEDWMPMEPAKGPPLPLFLNIFWPWYTPPGAEFKVSDLVVSPTEVNPGQPVTISCTVTNIGAAAGDYTVVLGGDFMAEKIVSLEPGQSEAVSFEVTPAEAKTFHVSVNGLTGSFVATEEAVADIRLENLVIEPAEVNIGQKVTISVTATNIGGAAGTKTIVCTVT
ncbi:hypothetical protein ES705_14055 [subsurface metagenome]